MPTDIQWTDETWNPVRGCSRVSPGCENCYAMGQARRFDVPGGPYEGLTRIGKRGVDWAGTARLIPEQINAPLHWRKPRRVFVNSMSDLFHESLSNEEIAAVFGVMAAAPQHTFQVLTKRSKRMRATVAKFYEDDGACLREEAERIAARMGWCHAGEDQWSWPLPNVWLGVSCEDQQRADERIPHLLATPAAVRFVSAEPLLGPVNIHWCLTDELHRMGRAPRMELDWVIVGSESGNGARPMDIAWARKIVDDCIECGTSVFTKQIANYYDRKGGNPEHWPPGDWPRQFPQ